jgi:circadian clock protein KaiB
VRALVDSGQRIEPATLPQVKKTSLLEEIIVYLLKVYISNLTPKTLEKIGLFKEMLTAELGSEYHLELVELLKNPTSALNDDILVTPTVIRCSPKPTKKIVGNFLDKKQVMFALGLVNP